MPRPAGTAANWRCAALPAQPWPVRRRRHRRGRTAGTAPRLPVNSQRRVVTRVVDEGRVSVAATTSTRRAPARRNSCDISTIAEYHMLRHATRVMTSRPWTASGCRVTNERTGSDGARYHTWHARMTNSSGAVSKPPGGTTSSTSAPGSTACANTPKNRPIGQGNGKASRGSTPTHRTSHPLAVMGAVKASATSRSCPVWV